MRVRQLGAFATLLFPLALGPAFAADLVLKRAMLSTGGVAYLEHEAEVSGDTTLSLDVPLDQIDDVLKSIVVYDNHGGVGSASLAGRSPLGQLYADLPFGADALASPAALLTALQGAEIKVGTINPITGRILAVVPETVRRGEQDVMTRNRVSLLTAAGLQQFILEEADSVAFTDGALQAKVDKTLGAISSHHAKDRRQIMLSIHGIGTRLVRIGYIVGAPLWKASFRLTLPQKPDAATAHLQGWAVLENMSGQDWKGIELTLLSGNPVSFRQALYQAYFVKRPDVPVEVANRILPRPDTGSISLDSSIGNDDEPDAARKAAPLHMRHAEAAPAPGALAMPMMRPAPPEASGLETPLRSRAAETADTEASATQVSFRLPTPLTIESGRSAIVPIFDRDMPVERLSLFQPETSATRPLASVRVKNDAAIGLPPGVLTIYEEGATGVAYAGDARLPQLPAGETRLLSYAVDDKTKILREEKSATTLAGGAIAQGVLNLKRILRQTTTYKIAAPTDEDRTIIIEQAKRQDWSVVAPKDGRLEETATAYRTTVKLKAGETKSLNVALEKPSFQTVQIGDILGDQIVSFASNEALDPAIRSALTEVVRLRRVYDAQEKAETDLRNAIRTLENDQARIRENLLKIDAHSTLHDLYIKKLTDQEAQFEANQAAVAKAAENRRNALSALNAYIATLKI